MKILQQLRDNTIAIISLFVAITALLYTAWREERTEQNRTIRVAAFEILKELGTLQATVNQNYYYTPLSQKNPAFLGWGQISFISDLSIAMPLPVPEAAQGLVDVWNQNWMNLHENKESADKVSEQIDVTRQAVLKVINQLS